MKPEPNFSWEEMDNLRETYVQPTKSEGSFTVEDWALRYKLSKSTARRELEKLRAEGLVEVARIPGRGGHLTAYYRRITHATKQANSV